MAVAEFGEAIDRFKQEARRTQMSKEEAAMQLQHMGIYADVLARAEQMVTEGSGLVASMLQVWKTS